MNFKMVCPKLCMLLAVGFSSFTLGCGGATVSQVAEQAPATTPSEEGSSTTSAPFDLQATMAREFEPLAQAEIKDPEGRWSGRMESAGVPTVAKDGDGPIEITVPVSTMSKIQCYVYPDTIDIASSMQNLFKRSGAAVSYRQIVPTVVEVVGDSAMVQMHGVYTVDVDNQKSVGLLKLAMYAHPKHSIMCTHDELGYNESFLRVIRGFFKSFETTQKLASSDLEELWTVHLGNMPVGFSHSWMSRNKDKTLSSRKQIVMVIPRSQVDFGASDEWVITNCDKNGYITNQKNVGAESGEVVVNIDIEKAKKGNYNYSGAIKEKPVEGSFKVADKLGLLQETFFEKKVEEILAKGGEETLTHNQYAPEIDPSRAMDARYEVKGKQSPKTVVVQMGDLMLIGTADDKGKVNQIVMPLGGAELVMKLAHSKGELKK